MKKLFLTQGTSGLAIAACARNSILVVCDTPGPDLALLKRLAQEERGIELVILSTQEANLEERSVIKEYKVEDLTKAFHTLGHLSKKIKSIPENKIHAPRKITAPRARSLSHRKGYF